ncbi:MAG: outer membrane protein assembly factor BamA [Aquificae bacterium]|nr:outer membrane protein assembly factor BamA [Aquificota bacterium]
MKKGLLALLALITLTHAQEIEKVIVKGNKYITEELIKGLLKTREGSQFSVEKIREDIRNLYRTGLFRSIEVYVEDLNKNSKPEVIFVVEDLPVIYKIEFEGNKELSDEDLKTYLGIETELGEVDVEETIGGFTSSPALEERLALLKKLKLGRILTLQEIESLKKRIEEIYRRKGFVGTRVEYKIIPKKGASKLVFIIREGQKVYTKEIKVEGNKAFSNRKIKKLMELKEPNLLLFRRHPAFSEETLREDVKKIEEFYRSEGFLEAEVSARTQGEGPAKRVIIEIKEGERYKLAGLEIEGNTLFAYSELVGDILEKNKRKGGYFRREVIEKVKRRIAEKYAEIGFLNVRIEEELKAEPRKKEVYVKLRIHEGEPVYVKRIRIKGNYETRDYVIRREMRVQENELATKKAIERSRTRIMNLGYYQNVQIEPVPRGAKWDLLVKITERFTGQFSVGLSYNEITGLTGFIEVRKGNFRGTGDILAVGVSYGPLYRNNYISYTRKWFLKRPMDLDLSLFDRRIEYTTYTVTRTGFSTAISKEFWEFWKFSVGTSFQRVRYSDISPEAVSYIKEQAGTRDSRKFFTALRRDTRDYYLLPTKGSLLLFKNTVGVGILGGDEEFYKLEFEGAKYFSDTYFDTGLILSVRAELGFAEGYNGKNVPIDERFFVGGDFSIRGYKYGYAGPLDPATNDPIGATRKLITSLELMYPLYKRMLFGAVFFDYGLGANKWSDFKLSNFRGGYGVGLRVITPFAPIRIDWAFKTKTVPGDTNRSRIHFVLGTFF